MKKKLTYFAAVALVLAACSSEEPIAPPMVENDAMGANPYRVSLTDALKNADALLGELGEGETTRSAERKVESVEYYSRPGTRANNGYFYWSKTNSLGGSPIETGPNDGNSTIDWVYDLSIKYMSGFNHN